MTDVKTCFIISPIGASGSDIRIFSDKVRKHIIDPVAKEKGFKTTRSDEIARPGRITSQIIERLKNDDLVVADLSRKNPNVFYELAIRHAVQKPVILMGESDLDIPFDLAAQRVIPYSIDPDDILEAKDELSSQIDEVESESFIVDSPVSDYIDITVSAETSEDQRYNRLITILENQAKELSTIKGNLIKSRNGTEGFIRRALSTEYRPITLPRSFTIDNESALINRARERFPPRYITILEIMKSKKAIKSKNVASLMGISVPSARRYLNRLSEAGYVTKWKDSSGSLSYQIRT